MSTPGTYLDLKEWACRMARFDATNSSDLALAGMAVNSAYMSTCGTGDPFNFLQTEGTWITTAGSDVYTFASIESAMGITGASIEEIDKITHDVEGFPLQGLGWIPLENFTQDTQDDPNGIPTKWSKWGGGQGSPRIRLWPTPDAAYTLGTYVRLTPARMSADSDTPLIPDAWSMRLLVPHAAATLLLTEGGMETSSEAARLMNQYQQDFIAFRTAYATAQRGTFSLATPGWQAQREYGSMVLENGGM